MIIEVPGVGNVEFPDGTPQSVIEGALSQYKSTQAPPANVQANPDGTYGKVPDGMVFNPNTGQYTSRELLANNLRLGAGASAITGSAQGATFGFADEIMAAIAAAIPGKGTAGQRYDFAREYSRAMLDASRRDHPVAAYGGEIAGGVSSSALLGGGGYVAGAKSLPSMMWRSALTGGGEGAVYGFGAGGGGAVNRLESAALSGAIGGGVGAAAPVIGQGIKLGYRAVANPVAAALNVPSPTRAARGIYSALKRSGMTADEVQAAIDSAASEGQGMFTIADALGPSGQGALNGAARTPGIARQEIVDFLSNRQGGQGDRLGSFLADALGAPDTAAQRTSNLISARGAAANTAYDAARSGAGPVDVRGALGVIDDRLGPMSQGMGITGDGIDASLARYRDRLAVKNPKTGISSVELSDFSRVLGVKQDVADEIGKAVRAGEGNRARELGKLKDALDKALESSSDAYRSANDEFARASRVIDAVDQGKAAASPRVRSSDTVGAFSSMTPEQQAAFRSGYSDPIIGKVESSAPGVNKARPLMNEKAAAELGAMAKDPALLNRQIGREDVMFKTANTAMGGSQTANNLADVQDVKGLDTSLLMNLMTGKFGQAGSQLVGKAVSAMDGRGEATRQLMAQALMSRNIKSALSPALKANAKSDANSALLSLFLRQMAIRAPQMVTQR